MLLTFSEFGRRAAENKQLATDHGTANVMLVFAGRSNRAAGTPPDLAERDAEGKPFTSDFRSIYAGVLHDWLNADAGILGGKFEPLALVETKANYRAAFPHGIPPTGRPLIASRSRSCAENRAHIRRVRSLPPSSRPTRTVRAAIAVRKLGSQGEAERQQARRAGRQCRSDPRPVGDADLAFLEGLSSLETLDLSYTRITDEGLKQIKGLKSLKRLALHGTKVTDAGLKEIAELENLEVLFLAETTVGDAGLKHLAGLKSLESLELD